MERGLEVFPRFGFPTQPAIRVAPVVVGIGVVWFQPDGLVIVGDGLLVPTQLVIRVAPIVWALVWSGFSRMAWS